MSWVRLPELFIECYPGVQTSRDELLVDIDRDQLVRRMKRYFSPSVSNHEMAEVCPCAMKTGKRFPAAETRSKLVARGFLAENVVRFSYRPLDDRWLYWEPEGKLLDEKRADYFPQAWSGNVALTAAGAIRKGSVEGPMPVAHLGCRHLIERGANIFTLFHRSAPDSDLHGERIEPNIDHKILTAACEACGVVPFEHDGHTWTKLALEVAECIFYHTLAVLWSPAYRRENEAALRQDWPRVPIPADADVLEASAKLGRTVADLLLPDKPVTGVTTGKLRPELRVLNGAARLLMSSRWPSRFVIN